MRKDKKTWIKQEKRLVKLLYKKGFLKDFKLHDFYWAEYHRTGKLYTSDNGKYRFSEYFPEIHYCTVDYWGEADEHSIVDHIKEGLYWSNVDTENWDSESDGYPKSTFKYYNRRRLIKYLNSLPSIITDNKINEIVNIRKKDY